MKRTLMAMALMASFGAFAQTTTTPPCPAGTVTCNNSTQHMGDTTQTASADNDQSVTNQAGNHTNSIASGVNINPSIQQSGNAVTQNGNSVQGGNASSVGNSSSNDNKSSASTGASSANNTGMNGLGGTATIGPVSTGASTSSVGPTSNSLTGGEQTSRNSNDNQATGGAGGAGGTARQGQALDSTNTVSGTTRSSADNSGGNSTTAVDASNRSVTNSRSNVTFLSDQPAVPMSFSPASTVSGTADTECGPYQEVISTPVYGYFFGTFKTKRVELDHNDTLAPPSRYDQESTMGVRVIYTTSVVNVAGARSLSIGGGGSSGWGQGSGGASSSMTVMVTHIQLRACRLAVERVPVFVPAYQPPPVERPVLVPHRRAVKKLPYCPPEKK